MSLSGLLNTLLFSAMLAQALALLSKRAEETHKDNLKIFFFEQNTLMVLTAEKNYHVL